MTTPALEFRGLSVWHPAPGGLPFMRASVRAVDGVTLSVHAAETVGLVGETGCGKSTLVRAAAGLVRPRSGEILFQGDSLADMSGRRLRSIRRNLQVVFQDAAASLDPRMTVIAAVAEPLEIHGIGGSRRERRNIAAETLALTGMGADSLGKYPHELSGGQRQRVGIARAAAPRPRVIVADEPVSALDASVQAQTLNMMKALKVRLGLSYLFVSHDLAVVGHMCERVAVMYLGRIVELAGRRELFARPAHPYTRLLLACSPLARRGVQPLSPLEADEGEPPNPSDPPAGCRFHPRCPFAESQCRRDEPKLRRLRDGRQIACHRAEHVVALEKRP